MNSSGISAMIQLGASLENDLAMETLSIGRDALSDEICVLELAGRHLLYRFGLRNDEVRLAVPPLDSAKAPDILHSPDTENGWRVVSRVIGAMEKHQIKSLQRPIKVGEPGDPDAWVIA
jgi:hypothetical protein